MAIRRSREDGLPETRLRHDFSSSPVLIYGASIARGNGWKEAVAFAEALDLLTAFQNKTPLIMTSGQQTREMLLMEPWLTNVEPTILPRPWVKWAYEPVRAEDIPAAFMRAIATALQPPSGPVFLSLPLDDWEKPCAGPAVVRSVGTRIAANSAKRS